MKRSWIIAMPDTQTVKLILLFSLSLLFKMMILHQQMHIELHYWLVAFMNLASIFFVYLLMTFLLKPEKRLVGYLWIHGILTVLIFINTVYYSHFYTLVPAHSVFQIGQLGGVTESIAALIKPIYFLYFIDTVVLAVLCRRKQLKVSQREKRYNSFYVLLLLPLVLGMGITFFALEERTEGHLTPLNLGMLNYHLVDVIQLFKPATVDPELAEEAVSAIVQEADERQFKGLLEGRNLFVIQAESLQTFVMEHPLAGQEITPVLNQLVQEDSIYFSRFYEQAGWGNTSDAEFVSHNSFYPSTKTFSYRAYENNAFYSLPLHLKKQGYTTMVFHGNDPSFWNRENAYSGQGIDHFYASEDFEMNDLIGMGLSDRELFQQSITAIRQIPEPFYAFYITLTSHHPFVMPDELQKLEMNADYKDTVLGHYLQSVHYLDEEIGRFIQRLKSEGLYDNAAIIIYGDHQGLDMRNEEANDLVSRFIRRPYEEDEMFRVPLIIHIPGSGLAETVETAGGQIDFFPTIANLAGAPLHPNRVMGKDLLNISEGFVAKQVHVAAGSFIDNEKVFIMSPDGLYDNSRAWKLGTGEPVSLEKCRENYERALAEITLSEYILQNDLIPRVQEAGLEGILDEIRQALQLEEMPDE
ncbi:LTA synthase family protein [Anoxynatronum buryatiense]|uniref:Phosphoglycerol transferase MdoB n=1 Tax=Anoxynatronum buryatiense TaxID=489973 RepID=A0AA45WUQ1_9CLOT|nr:LTA synthase family protein [Anoxynatronum buryatiense]SMP44637.1 Phosphoglycerol transferase MdoB [Anoxynatronum buryatiense]